MSRAATWFQSTPPRGGRRGRGAASGQAPQVCFNPRPRAGGDSKPLPLAPCGRRFNPRPRAGGDKRVAERDTGATRFQSTPPRGGRRRPVCSHSRVQYGFNPRPRAGGDRAHADIVVGLLKFQSTPPRGGRLEPRRHTAVLDGFNPRPRAGGDSAEPPTRKGEPNVSIHAPARGATGSAPGARSATACFNPRPRAGGDASRRQERASGRRFQSTPPRGGRPSSRVDRAARVRFQSTPPRGGRPSCCCRPDGSRVRVSIHAPARGATFLNDAGRTPAPSFNPRPRAGGDRVLLRITRPAGFNPRPRAGGDQIEARRPREWLGIQFQSTPPRGGRPPSL